jgi:hypothetical protein
MHCAVYYRIEETPVPADTKVDNTGQPHLIGLLASDKQWKVAVQAIINLTNTDWTDKNGFAHNADAIVIMRGRELKVQKNRHESIVNEGVLLKAYFLFLRYADRSLTF